MYKWESGNKLHLRLTDIWQGYQDYLMGKKTPRVFDKYAGTNKYIHAKKKKKREKLKVEPLSHSTYKNYSKLINNLNIGGRQ